MPTLLKSHTLYTPGGNERKSYNAIAAPAITIPGNNTWTKVLDTPLPRLKAAESGASATVPDELADSFLARMQFQINSLTAPEPTQFLAELNFRNISNDAIASNLGFSYIVGFGSGSIANLEWISYEWPYTPYNNVPSAPFIQVYDGSAYKMSLDLRLNSGAGGITVVNAMVVVEAGNYYTPGTTQFGNSVPPGPIGVLG